MLFPSTPGVTGLNLAEAPGSMPQVCWLGVVDFPDPGGTAFDAGCSPLVGEHSSGLLTRPHLRGHRVTVDGAGRDWTTAFSALEVRRETTTLGVRAEDRGAGLTLSHEFESVPGGALRARATVTNIAAESYLLEGLEVVLPVSDRLTEVLDFTGRHERERTPQRHELTDGLYLRESRGGRPGFGSPTLLAVGAPGFGTDAGDVVAAHVAWSGNSVLRIERDAASGTTLGGGELLLPGEVVLAEGTSYTTPWVHFVASHGGLDGVADAWHNYLRSLPSHPVTQPVTMNVWEAVYFDHDQHRLRAIADRAAAVGVERFVLDDGWFLGRRDDTRGLGDWVVDPSVWPEGLSSLADHVCGLGMEFGLWFEPEMVNPDSELFRAHPDWVLSPRERLPRPQRHQQVLDLANPEVSEHLFERMTEVIETHQIAAVKWDHNRDLLEAGSPRRGGAPSTHDQTVAFYRLLDRLIARHPTVSWESCASGGGRIDLGVLERVQRVWASDMTDALARQQIQRWTVQLVAPEYLGAHVSAPRNHVTGRTWDLGFRAATALFGAMGIEWDLLEAEESQLQELASWVELHKRYRDLLHSGRVVRPTSSDPAVLLHGVVAQDASEGLLAHVQLDESAHNRGVRVRVQHLPPQQTYALGWEGPTDLSATSMATALPRQGPTSGVPVSGAWLGSVGFFLPRRRPGTVTLVRVRALIEESE
jgi:alpha-galactosidase